MKKNIYVFKPREVIFLTALILFIIKQISVYSLLPSVMYTYGTFSKVIEVFIILLFGGYCFISNYSIRRLIVMSIICLMALVSVKSGGREIFYMGLLLYMSTSVDNRRIVKVTMNTLLISVGIIILLCIAKVLPNNIYYNTLTNGTIVEANSLGFDYYSYIPIYTLFFSCMYIYIRNKKCSYLELIFMFVLAFVVNHYCHKELTFWLNILLLILYVGLCKMEIFKYKSALWKSISIGLVPLSFIIVAFFSYNYPKFRSLDSILGGRLYYGYTAFNRYNIPLFGEKIQMVGSSTFSKNTNLEYFYIDSGYLQTLFLRGLILTSLVIIGYIIISYQSIKIKNIELFIWIVITAIYNTMGSTLIDVWYNPLFFIAFKYIANCKTSFIIRGKKYRIVCKKNYKINC